MPSLLDGFETKEDLLKYVTEKLTERDSKFWLDEVLDLQKESDKRKTLLDKEIGLKKTEKQRAQDAEAKVKELEAENAKHVSEIESLQKPGEHEEKMAAMAKELAAAKTDARNKDSQVTDLQKKLDATKEPLEELGRLKITARNNRIYESVRKEAIDAKVPADVYDSDEFKDHVLARFTIDDTDEVVTIGDSSMNAKQFVASKQKTTPRWVESSQPDHANPGKNRSSLDGRAEKFAEAQKSGNLRDMIAYAPPVETKG